MLGHTLPRSGNTMMPWDAIPWRPRIHLALFVHRVDGLEAGLYALPRDPEKVQLLRSAMHKEFAWERPPSCPPGLPLFLLRTGDVFFAARTVFHDPLRAEEDPHEGGKHGLDGIA